MTPVTTSTPASPHLPYGPHPYASSAPSPRAAARRSPSKEHRDE